MPGSRVSAVGHLAAYDARIDAFAAASGPGEVVVLEPDAVAQWEGPSAPRRADRFALPATTTAATPAGLDAYAEDA
ncbi:hypothetical protein [Streptomyces glomeratus]|uniref:Uncharacterized protein n=1 Tax=Streptomyces glomeratus TaxID=284452 RepID=A0ABN3YEA5_9ACTN